MLRTLTWKETRELAPLALVALLGQAIVPLFPFPYAGSQLYPDERTIPFVGDTTSHWILFVGVMAALVLGLWQAGGELLRGTYLFLLHRPLERPLIFGTKLFVGIVLTLLVAAVPLAMYTAWAALPGRHASPFFWSMALPDWLNVLRLPIVYLGAFLSGLRPGRWLGSRLLPLAAGVFCYLMLLTTNNTPVVGLVLTLALEAMLLVTILYVAQSRDFS